MSEYTVSKLSQSMKIDGDWNKPQWKNIKELDINNRMGDKPLFTPTVQAKMMYDNENLYRDIPCRRQVCSLSGNGL